jgi:hypothetical protein
MKEARTAEKSFEQVGIIRSSGNGFERYGEMPNYLIGLEHV